MTAATFPESGNKTALVFVKMGWEDDASGLSGEDKINDRHPVFIRKAFTYAAQYAAGKLELRDNTIERPNRKSRAFYQLARHLKKSGVKIDGVGLQCHFDLDGPNDLMQPDSRPKSRSTVISAWKCTWTKSTLVARPRNGMIKSPCGRRKSTRS